jgi:hypothetical protein
MRFLLITVVAGYMLTASDRCASCHAEISASFQTTGMGRSVSAPVQEAVPRQEWNLRRRGIQAGSVWRDGTLEHRVGPQHRAVSLAIGSGAAGKSYLWWAGDALFQSPISWYTELRKWDLSPGYDRDSHPDFFRPITAECLFCHTGGIAPMAGTQNRYASRQIDPIGCERCHGSGESHMRKASSGNIVNPARLPAERRDSVCEACHLSGEARIPNRGRTYSDFRPGMLLEEVFTVYTAVREGEPLKVVSHAEQMAASLCSVRSGGKLWCASCHDPHSQPAPEAKAAYFRQRCQTCHERAPSHSVPRGDDCAGCHMPKSNVSDGGHTAFTDHWIRVPGRKAPPATKGLRPWRAPVSEADAQRNLALAYLAAAEKRHSLEWMQQAVQLLNPLLANQPDGVVLTAGGLLALRQGKTKQGVEFLRQACAADPGNATAHANLAAAYLEHGKPADAAIHAKEALRIEPLLGVAYAILVEAEPGKAAEWQALYRQRTGR